MGTGPEPDPRRATPRAAALLVLAALLVRLALGLVLHLPAPRPAATYAWDWAWEQGAVARSVAEGRGLADPFLRDDPRAPFAAAPTGPTAWCGPVFPLLLGGLVRVTDGPNHGTALGLAGLQCLLSALTALGLLRLGEALGRPRLGRFAGWTWALLPSAAHDALALTWDSVTVGALLVWVLVLQVRAVERARRDPERVVRHLVPAGLALGFLGLLNATALALAPAFALQAWLQLRAVRPGLPARLTELAALALPAFVVLLPWLVRNQRVLGVFAPKANLGVELHVGNNDGADGVFTAALHPAYDAHEHARLRELGEGAYGRDCMARFRAWVAEHPRTFLELCALRVRLWWFGEDPTRPIRLRNGEERARSAEGWVRLGLHAGLGLLALLGCLLHRDPRGGRVLLGGALLLFPLVYYASHVLDRYRTPVEPLMVLLALSALLWLKDRRGRRGTADLTS